MGLSTVTDLEMKYPVGFLGFLDLLTLIWGKGLGFKMKDEVLELGMLRIDDVKEAGLEAVMVVILGDSVFGGDFLFIFAFWYLWGEILRFLWWWKFIGLSSID